MLKKQTVWLLTMLSLMIVLSVYYITSPDSGDFAYVDSGNDNSEETTQTDSADNQEDAEVVDEMTNLGQDELFTTIRMELQDERSMQKELLEKTLASGSASAEEKNEAKNQMALIDQVSTKESILEQSILAAADDYQDVLVRHDEDKVFVHVKTNELPTNEVVNIMQMVKDEFGEITVNVNWQQTE